MRRLPKTSVRRTVFEELEPRSMLSATGMGVLSGGGFAYDSLTSAMSYAPGAGGYGYGYGYGGVASGGFGNDGSGGAGIGNASFGNQSFGNGSYGSGSFGGAGTFSAPTGSGSGLGTASSLGTSAAARSADAVFGSENGVFEPGSEFDFGIRLNFGTNDPQAAFASAAGESARQFNSPTPDANSGTGQMTLTTGANTLGISSFATSTNGISDISGGAGHKIAPQAPAPDQPSGEATPGPFDAAQADGGGSR